MHITVLLCTYNRCQSLRKTLESLALSTLDDAIQWDVLVVDNNSTDQTREVVGEFLVRSPSRFRYLFEPQQGKSYALNAGIREARGEVLAFTDDDVTVEPAWLQNLVAPFVRGDCAGVGGRTLAERTFSPPSWLETESRYALAPLAVFDRGTDPCELPDPPFGNNMAYRREVFKTYGEFRTELGPSPGSEIRSEDTEFGQRLLSAGERLLYEPRAVVYHAVPESRVRKSYFLAWWFDKARADVREFGIPVDTTWRLRGVLLYLFRRLAVWTFRWMFCISPCRRFFNKRQVWWVAGTIVECFRQSTAPRRFLRPNGS